MSAIQDRSIARCFNEEAMNHENPAALHPSNEEARRYEHIVRRLIEEGVNQGTLAVTDELLAPTASFYFSGCSTAGDRESWKLLITLFRTAFPDLRTAIEEQVTEGDQVVTRMTLHGTHQGDFQGSPLPGCRARLRGA